MENLPIENMPSVLLPYILQALKQKPELSDTYENLCEEIKYILSAENHGGRYGNIDENIENALDIGQNLGILVITNDLIRMPFKYNKGSKRPNVPSTLKKNQNLKNGPSTLNKRVQKAASPQKFLLNPPRRTHSSVRQTLKAHKLQGRSRRRSSNLSRSRSRSRGSRRQSRPRRH